MSNETKIHPSVSFPVSRIFTDQALMLLHHESTNEQASGSKCCLLRRTTEKKTSLNALRLFKMGHWLLSPLATRKKVHHCRSLEPQYRQPATSSVRYTTPSLIMLRNASLKIVSKKMKKRQKILTIFFIRAIFEL